MIALARTSRCGLVAPAGALRVGIDLMSHTAATITMNTMNQ